MIFLKALGIGVGVTTWLALIPVGIYQWVLGVWQVGAALLFVAVAIPITFMAYDEGKRKKRRMEGK